MFVTYPDVRYLSRCSLPIQMCIDPRDRPSNFARNSRTSYSNIEFRPLELQRFHGLLKLHPIELRAKCWEQVTVAATGAPQTTNTPHRRKAAARGILPGHGLVVKMSDLVGHGDRRVIREALRVLVGAADLEGTRALAQGGRRVLIVDAPARVVDEGLTAP